MNNLLKWLFIVLSVWLIIGCCDEDEYWRISEEDKLIYELFDTLVYKSNTGVLDTFYVSDISQWFDEHPNYDMCGTAVYIEKMIYRFLPYPNSQEKLFNIKYFHPPNIHFGVFWYSDHFDIEPEITPLVEKLSINDSVYYNLYEVQSNEDTAKVQKLLFHKKYGIVRYEFRNKESWSLYKTLKNL
jgi:hypothetical protein